MSESLAYVFSFVCGQYPPHTWVLGGQELPCCQRCTGLYAGAALALFLQLRFRPCPTFRYRLIHGLCLLQMAPMGLHLVPQDALLRCLSGQLFAFGVMAFMWLLPSSWRGSAPAAVRPEKNHYWMGAGLSLPVIPLLVAWGGPSSAVALSALAWVGGCALAVLGTLHLVHGGTALVRRGRQAIIKFS